MLKRTQAIGHDVDAQSQEVTLYHHRDHALLDLGEAAVQIVDQESAFAPRRFLNTLLEGQFVAFSGAKREVSQEEGWKDDRTENEQDELRLYG